MLDPGNIVIVREIMDGDGQGHDKAVYPRGRQSYTCSDASGELPECPTTWTGERLTISGGNEGTDTLTGIEELVFGELSTGAEKDIEQATLLARMMVERWGMSEAVGPVTVLDGDSAVPGASAVAEDTRRLVDQEVRAIAESSYDEAVTLLREHRERLERLAAALLERETLDQAEVYRIAALDGAEG